MVLDQELDGRRVVGIEVEPARHVADEGYALLGMAVTEGLADVVEQDAEHEELRALHLGDDLRELFRLGAPAGTEPLQDLHGKE